MVATTSTIEIEVPIPGHALPGILARPHDATGLVVFAHGSGSSRHSPRNRFVAEELQRANLATLLFDLLTPGEAADRTYLFDVGLLAGRLLTAVAWVRSQAEVTGLPVGCFGASTGGAAALWAAGEPGSAIAAVVSRGGRPDLAGERRLRAVRAPTLLVVGGWDTTVLELNERAARHLRCVHELAVVPGATHLFEEPGTLATAADLAAAWFDRYLAHPPA